MKPPGSLVYVAFGSNVGNRISHIKNAIGVLSQHARVTVLRISPIYQTDPVGGPKQNKFLNGVMELETTLSPNSLWKVLIKIEERLGRKRRVRWGPRTLDLDILTFGRRRVRSSHLRIPHPRYHERRFVLVPFCRLAPDFIHPVFKTSNRSLLRQLTVVGQRVTMLSPWKNSQFAQSKIRKEKKNRSSR